MYGLDCLLSRYLTHLPSNALDLTPLAILSKGIILKYLRVFQEPLIFENFYQLISVVEALL